MANLYHLPELPDTGPTELTGDVAHHLARVLRVRVGETVRLGDGRGKTAIATVTEVHKQRIAVELGPIATEQALRPALTLAFAVPRPSRADWLVEHATELGVHRLQPLWTQRSRPQGLRADRWRKVARAAAGQCARAWLPEVAEPIELAHLLENPQPGEAQPGDPQPGQLLLADQHGGDCDLAEGTDRATLLIGPEGGLSPEERDAALAAGYVPMRFGAHILRTETAAVIGAGILLRGCR